MFDWAIRNAVVVDGANGERRADVYLKEDRIAAVLAAGTGMEALHDVDAAGFVLAPGFIDIHRHADLMPFSGQPWSELAQGITSMVSGNCGFSPTPNAPESFEAMREYAAPILGSMPDEICGMSTAAFYDAVARRPLKVNCGYLVGNGDLRRSVAGFSDAPLTSGQLEQICARLEEALRAGAMGLSMGLMYTPECYYTTDELSCIAAVAARYDKPVIVHIRGEGHSVVRSVDEVIAIGRASGARMHICHMKAAGVDMWGSAVDTMLAHIRQAQREGIDVTFDAYPYTAGSTTLLSLLPPEALARGTQGVLQKIAVPAGRREILDAFKQTRDDWDNFAQCIGWGRIIVSGSSNPAEAGKTIEALAAEKDADPGEYALDLLLRENGCVSVVLEEMAPDDVRKIISQQDCIVISDSLYSRAGMPHPRKYGAFERFLCQYVKEEKLLTRQEAIDRITRMPAEFLGIARRGLIREGYYADLVLLDWEALKDRASYADPIQDSVGIQKVFVNGELAFEAGKVTQASAGALLNRC